MFQRFDIHSRIVQRSGITFYGARDKLLGREVWLWRLFEFAGSAPPDAELLNAEKVPLRTLRHPGIVTLHDIEADPDGVVALLDPVEGDPFDAIMARGPVAIADFQSIARQSLGALAAASAAGVPHGGLEPALMFVAQPEGRSPGVRIAGFGITRLLARLRGEEHETSEALDVWMLGSILHAALTGTAIEEGQAVQPPHEIRAEVPEAISAWLMEMLADDAAVRPQTAADALARLEQALTPPPAAAEASAPPAHWPPAYDPNPHPQPAWHYPPVAVWHGPPAQWTQPYDQAQAAQQPQLWQQVPWQQMPHDPYQQQFLQQQQMMAQQQAAMHAAAQHHAAMHAAAQQQAAAQHHAAMQAAAHQAAAAPPPPAVAPPAQVPAPSSSPSKTQPLIANQAGPKPRLPTPPKTAAAGPDERAALPGNTDAAPAKDPRRFIGPAISIATMILIIWFFRSFFSAFLDIDVLRNVFGSKP